jgi:tetratricopeptide (TPR) repeat protein
MGQMRSPLPPFLLLALLTTGLGAAPRNELAESIVLTPQAGTEKEDVEIARWQQRAGAADARAEYFDRLAWSFVAKARRTLDAGYYKLAEKTADAMDARFGASPDSRLLRGHVLHNLHRFREAEAVARQLVAERTEPADFALLSDALVEQGRLGEAITALQRMSNLKPGAEADSRIAHVRWLKGDLTGATTAMESAMRATSPRDAETYAWMLARLSNYYLQAGQAPRALMVAKAAVKSAAIYPPALLARGRALLAVGKIEPAVAALQEAAALNPLPEYQWWLADALREAGKAVEAGKIEEQLRARGEAADPRTYALFLATRRTDVVTAVRLAREELENRADVFTHDALAWALAAGGELAGAQVEMKAALAEHTKDARLFFHAGEIALARGEAAAAAEYFSRARSAVGVLTPSEHAMLARRLAGATAMAKAN